MRKLIVVLATLAVVALIVVIMGATPLRVRRLPPPPDFSTMSDDEKMQFVRTRTVADLRKVVPVSPTSFLERLTPDSRREFLSALSPEHRREFMKVKTSAELFNLLTPDERATLAVKFTPRFADAAIPADPRVTSPFPPRTTSKPAGIYTTLLSPRKTIAKIPPKAPISRRPPGFCGLSKSPCYFSYQATLETDRDGTPCTYGPYPCGSGFPNDVNETPFCPGPDADNYGCGALANQVLHVTDCPRQPNKKGVPLEHICNATNPAGGCSYADVSKALFTSVVTDCNYPNIPGQPKRCIIDSYKDPQTGHTIMVPVKTDRNHCSPCIQQSEPGACGGINCPCPGLYISQTAYTSPNAGAAPMNPDNYLNAVLVPFTSLPKRIHDDCALKTGMLVLMSAKYDPVNNPTEDPKDWVAGILADKGGKKLGEVSYATWYALGMPPDSAQVTFRVYPQVKLGWPVDKARLDQLKDKYIGVCCAGNIDDQCHASEERGTCVKDKNDPLFGSCDCRGDWLPDPDGDCTWNCPGSDDARWIGTATESGFEECTGNGHCTYAAPDAKGEVYGECDCDPGWWSGLTGKSCTFRDCVKFTDWSNTKVEPCYGHGDCTPGANPHNTGSCSCDEGWWNGANGQEYCGETACPNACSGHGDCLHTADGKAFCSCDIEHGWGGADCSVQGCVTQEGFICSGNGNCVRDEHGTPVCQCADEWGGGRETGPQACAHRRCPGCPRGAATCTSDWNWEEIFCLCVCGEHCAHNWRCHCNDKALKPPACNTKNCCNEFWGECNSGLHGQGVEGGGTCGANGVCQCYNDYDPNRCCGYPKEGAAAAPNGFGHPCPGASSRTLQLACSGPFGPCGACPATSVSDSWTLTPQGGGNFVDQNGTTYNLAEPVCSLTITRLAPGTYGGSCGKTTEPKFWLNISGNAGTGMGGTLCTADCAMCNQAVPCTVRLQ